MSFGWNCMFRKGSWLEFRRFVLLQRKNVPDRILSINQELSRIGRIVVSYEKVDGRVTEKRTGFYVDEKSALGKLIIAYIAQGGNPFDISMFLSPDSYKISNTEDEESPEWSAGGKSVSFTQPYGGVIYPQSQEEDEFKGQDQRGWLPLWKFPPRKLGGNERNIYPEADEIGGQIAEARRWVRQEITQLRNDLEARIIKLCDLREQLIRERDEVLYNALVGSVAALEDFDPDEILLENHLSSIVTNIDLNFFEVSDAYDSVRVPDHSKPLPLKTPLSLYQCLLDDAPSGEEENTAL
jgi:hypothetical protein